MGFGEFVFLPAVQVLLHAEECTQVPVGMNGRIDEHCPQPALFRKPGRVETAQRRAGQGHRPLWRTRQRRFDRGERLLRLVRQRRTVEARPQTPLFHVATEHLGLIRLRGGVKAVQVDQHEPLCARVRSRSISLAWMPPKLPLDITSTWSPERASADTADTSASRSSAQDAFGPSGASAARGAPPPPNAQHYTPPPP